MKIRNEIMEGVTGSMFYKIYRLIRGFAKQMNRINVSAYASSAAFFIFLSLIPVLILICSIVPYTPLHKSDILTAVTIMPAPIVPLMIELVESLYDSTVAVISVAAAAVLWSAGKGVLAIMRGLNAMNGVEEDRNYFVQRIMASIYTIVLLAVLILSLVLMVFGNTLVRMLTSRIPITSNLFHILVYFKPFITWAILAFVFAVMYARIPNCKLKIKKQIPGAVFAAVSWTVFSWAFSIYVEKFNPMNMYGSLSAIIILMLWLYFCIYLLLAGAHLNRFAAPFFKDF